MDERYTGGVIIGIVDDLEDEEGLGRVRVKYPALGDELSDWARVATLMAGANRGAFFRPEKDDEVVVAFEHNDPRRPYILGAVWSKVDQPPSGIGPSKQNDVRLIRSRSGHVVKLDDTPGKEKIEIIDKDEAHKIVIDSSAKKIQVISDTGDVEVSAKAGTVKVEAMTVKVEATTVEVKATGNMNLEATGNMTIKGALIDISGSGPVTVAGTPIKLN